MWTWVAAKETLKGRAKKAGERGTHAEHDIEDIQSLSNTECES